jgi:peptidoglycan hydrolase-like protein with peptidoglycan-binding domain
VSGFANVFDFPPPSVLRGVGLGATGDDVRAAQAKLAKAGFQSVPQNGAYGPLVAGPVAAIQRQMKRPDNGVYDGFIDTTLDRALSTPGTLEANAVAAAVREWNTTGMQATVSTTALAPPQTVQVSADGPIWKKPVFWLVLFGGGIALWSIFRPKHLQPTVTGREGLPEGVDEPGAFFSESPPKKRRRRKKKAEVAAVEEAPAPRKRKRKKAKLKATSSPDDDAVGEPLEALDDDDEVLPPVEVAPDVVVEATPDVPAAVEGPPKPKRRRRKNPAPESRS